MSFGGSVAAMVTSLKNNARPKRRFEDRFNTHKIELRHAIKDKNLPKIELEKIKLGIRIKLTQQRRKRRITSAIIIVLLSLILLSFISLISGKYNVNFPVANKELKQKEKNKESIRNDNKAQYIVLGEVAINNGNYSLAKSYFNKAYIVNSKDREVIISTIKVYVLDCIENNLECGLCDYYLEIGIEEIGIKSIEKALGTPYFKLKEKKAVEEKIQNEEIIKLLNIAYKELDKKNLSKAKKIIYQAYHLDKENYYSNIEILRISIEDCFQNEENCYWVEHRFKGLERKFGLTAELIDLRELYNSRN